MKKIHFRIIELPTHQVLLTKDFDNQQDENTPLLRITIFVDNCRAEISLGFDTEEKRDKAFINYSDEIANTCLQNILKEF